MNWERYQKEFEWDGSLQDIYIFKTSLDDWQKLLDFIRAGRYTFEYKIDGDAVALPERAATIFECENSQSLLSVIKGNLLLNCHFFTVDEIEFDLDPREVKAERDLEELFDFLRQLRRISNKQTVLTPENAPKLWIFRFIPGINEPEYQAKSNQARLVRYGERKRPEHRSTGLLIYAQVAYAPRTVPPRVPMLPGSI